MAYSSDEKTAPAGVAAMYVALPAVSPLETVAFTEIAPSAVIVLTENPVQERPAPMLFVIENPEDVDNVGAPRIGSPGNTITAVVLPVACPTPQLLV